MTIVIMHALAYVMQFLMNLPMSEKFKPFIQMKTKGIFVLWANLPFFLELEKALCDTNATHNGKIIKIDEVEVKVVSRLCV